MRTSPVNFQNDTVNLFVAAEFEFDSGAFRIWSGYGEIVIDGKDYTGAGTLMSVGSMEESPDVSAKGIDIVLSGLDESVISATLNEDYQNRIARVLIGTVDDGVYSAYTMFSGRMDVMEIEDTGETVTVRISAENRLIDLERPRSSRYTSEDQKTYYPNDLGLDYVADLQEKQINWGR